MFNRIVTYILLYMEPFDCVQTIEHDQKSGKHCVRHTEALDNFFDLIRSHQQYKL